MTTIRVVDSIMGSGKTSAAINMMNNDIDDYGEGNNYIFITPYLSEVERVKDSCAGRKFYEPKIYTKNGETFYKLDSLHQLLKDNKNIATTHSLFKMATEETKELIYTGNYILILDEVMEVVRELHISASDVKMLFNEGWIYLEDGFVLWNNQKEIEEGTYTGEFVHVKKMAQNRNLVLHNNTILLWNFPNDIFGLFKDTYILTYLFDAQIQKSYFDMFGIKYERYIATCDDNGRYVFKPNNGHSDKPYKNKLKSKIHIYDGTLNRIGNKPYSLSKSWFKDNKALRGRLKNNVLNYFTNILKSKSEFNMWTTFKDYQNSIKGKGYSKGYVSLTSRSTNEYRHKTALAYAANRYLNPIIDGYFLSRGVKVDEDYWALSEMLQWIWRSAIRDDKDINIYIPSSRMRSLLVKWLDDEL
jgi:hypothetical protein